jgi:hypothetical protein
MALGLALPALGVTAPAGAVGPDPLASLPANATWLQTLNAWRTASHVDPVTENTAWSAGDAAHSKYIVETGDFGHDEDNGGPFATVDGLAAGLAGNVAASGDASKTDRGFIEQWITAPFHAAGMLDSHLATTGFGSYRRADATPWRAAATLDVIRGRTPGFPLLATTFPGYNSVLPVAQTSYRGGESPDPLAPCSGYEDGGINTGVPLFALLPAAPNAGTLTASLTRQESVDIPVASCAYDETSYTNADPNAQTLGRAVLAGRHQVIVVPKLPLAPDATYHVSISETYSGAMSPTVTGWSFTTAALPQVSIGSAAIVEGQSGSRSVRLTASLSSPSATPVSVHYATSDGTATAPSDYRAQSGTITFAPGTTSAAVPLTITGDRVPEANEAFTVRLSSPQGATVHRSKGTVSVLTDDRAGSPTTGVRVSVGAASMVEGNSGGSRSLRMTVALSTPSTSAVHVHYATETGTATSADFGSVSGNLTIAPGAATALLAIRVKADTTPEPTEQFTLRLTDPTGAVIDRATAVGSIIDDD